MSCSNSQWEQKLEECKARDRERCYRDADRSRRNSRWQQKSAERKARDRDRSYQDDDRNGVSNEHNSKRSFVGAKQTEIVGSKSGIPNCTIMIRGLACHITEDDIRQEIILCGLMSKDIRLVLTKDKEASRGFAFVEFFSVDEASRWMDIKQGVLVIQDQYRAVMQYSIPKAIHQDFEKLANKAALDWFCIKCGAQNFRRRESCFKCYSSRTESENGGSGSDEVCNYVTKTVMLRNLDALTTEDSVIQSLDIVMSEVTKKISGVRIGRDPLTSTSRGICYLKTDSIVDALVVYGALTSCAPPLNIDGKTVTISYCKYNMGNTEKTYDQAIQAAFPDAKRPTIYSLNDVSKLAEYSASRYAKTTAEYQQYFEYYTNYFAKQIKTGSLITLLDNQTDAGSAAAAVAQSAIQQKCAAEIFNATELVVPNGMDGKHYPIPDITRYTYENVSGYYYDCSTGLYYDPNSTYYWNSVIQKYLYYDQEKLTYLLAQVSSHEGANTSHVIEVTPKPKVKKSKIEKNVKGAKKIVKNMERWAKTLNQKKEPLISASSPSNDDGFNTIISAGSADIGYLVLETQNNNSFLTNCTSDYNILGTSQALINSTALEAVQRDNETSDEQTYDNEMDFLDFTKSICKLCKRQLPSAELLLKHATFSNLHKNNLETFIRSRKNYVVSKRSVYHDVAKERKKRYGDTNDSQSNEMKKKYLQSTNLVDSAASGTESIICDNVGSRLLLKRSFSERHSLGKTNQERSTIFETEKHSSTVGIRNQTFAGNSYKDKGKKLLYAQYQKLNQTNI